MTDTTESTTEPIAAEPAAEAPQDSQPAPAEDAADDDGATALGGKGDAPIDEADDGGEAAPLVPESYDLAMPEGFSVDADLLDEATPVFKEIGLSNEAANKLMPFAAKLLEKSKASFETAMIEAGAAQRKGWLDEAKAAEDIGGGNWEATLHAASRGLDALGYTDGSPFRQFLNETGMGNHPDMIRIAAKLGELAGEDGSFARADAGAPVDVLSEMYPHNRRSK